MAVNTWPHKNHLC